MPQPDTTTIGAPCWVDLFSSDTDRARAFYGGLFGWTAESAGPEFGGYINFSSSAGRIAGCMHNDGSWGSPDGWNVYLRTPDAEATTAATAANGGQVYVPPMPIADLGTMGMVADPGGAAIGLWQPGTHAGFAAIGEPGAPGWFELHTRDYAAAVAFYRTVFQWDAHTMSDTPEFRYTTLGRDESAQAGIMDAGAFLPDGVPAHWSIYFAVENADDAAAKIVELGGAVTMPPEDTPYGRIAQATDPTGAMFKIVQ